MSLLPIVWRCKIFVHKSVEFAGPLRKLYTQKRDNMPSQNGHQLNVTKLFDGASILITGASGFLGKVLLEKLLYSLPRIGTIYLLIRPLKGEEPNVRLEKLLASPLFNRIRCLDESRFKKLIVVNGDLMQEELGLGEGDRELLTNEVSVVFHCAATVKFDEALRVSIQMNVIGTQRLITLCRRMKRLQAIVHASTAYANCHLASTEERIYEQSVDPAKLVEATCWMSNEMLDSISAQLLQGRPNTYTFTKSLAESQLREEQKRHPLPIIIIRPSIIGAIWKEPLPGWIDNVNGATGIFIGVGKGLLTDMCGDSNATADIIPVDIVANMLIVAAAHRAQFSLSSTDEIPLIHCTSGELNPLKWGRIANLLEQFCHTYPFEHCYRIPSAQFHQRRKTFAFNFYAKHYAMAVAADMCYRIVGKRPKFVPIYNKIWRMIETLHYFTTRGWSFESKNAIKLWNSMSDEDRKMYNFDVRKLDWEKYLFDYLMGIKLYLLKEHLDSLPKAQASLLWMKQLNLYASGLFFAILVRLFAWRRPKRQKWALWFGGFSINYIYQNFNHLCRHQANFRSLEEYKRVALPYFIEYDQQKTGNS